jgi:hypothetical protein
VLDGLLGLIQQIFHVLLGQPGPSPTPVTGDEPLQTLTPRVLLIVYDPVVNRASGQKLSEAQGWNRVQDLVAGYIADVEECSGGLVKYNVVGRVDVDEFPLKADRFRYAAAGYLDVLSGRAQAHDPDFVDYQQMMSDHNLLARAANGEFDEVWLFGGPYFGFWEAAMAGTGAFFCNGGPIPNSPCPRKFVIMGFSYQRGVGEMLEDLGHRAETTLAHLFGSDDFWGWAYNHDRAPKTTDVGKLNLLERFLCFDQIAPGKSNVGTLHYAPNSTTDYEWGIATPVQSCADDWNQFPNLPDPPNFRTMTTQDWGGGDIRAHHKWWLKHLPKVAGRINGISNNWWKYVADPNNVP